MCLLYVLHFTDDLENREVPGWPKDFWTEVTGFILGFRFSSFFSKFNHPGFILLPVLELIKWKPTFVCSLPLGATS